MFRYIQVLKEEKSSDSTPRSLDKELNEPRGSKKSIAEMEKTIFTLKRIIEKLQVENKRMKINCKNHVSSKREVSLTLNTFPLPLSLCNQATFMHKIE